MNKSDKPIFEENDKEYQDIIDILTPKNVPKTKLHFVKPYRKKISWIVKISACFIGILLVGLLVILSTHNSFDAKAAINVFEKSLQQMASAENCRIDFVAIVKPRNNYELFSITPDGEEIRGVFTHQSRPVDEIDVKWYYGDSLYEQIFRDNYCLNFKDRQLIDSIVTGSQVKEIKELLNFQTVKISDFMGDINVTNNRDTIIVDLHSEKKNEFVNFNAKFLKNDGKLFSIMVSYNGKPILKTNNITYY